MLQRDRQIRTQVQQIADASLFAASFWLAYVVRGNESVFGWLGLDSIGPEMFAQVYWIYFLLVPAAPLVLESQGFYKRPVGGSRAAMFWPLLKSCVIITVGLVLVVFIRKEIAPRGVMVFFGAISFGLVWAKEEVLRIALRSRLARAQYKRRIIVAG